MAYVDGRAYLREEDAHVFIQHGIRLGVGRAAELDAEVRHQLRKVLVGGLERELHTRVRRRIRGPNPERGPPGVTREVDGRQPARIPSRDGVDRMRVETRPGAPRLVYPVGAEALADEIIDPTLAPVGGFLPRLPGVPGAM